MKKLRHCHPVCILVGATSSEGFWATVCKTVRPSMLSDRCPVLSFTILRVEVENFEIGPDVGAFRL